MPSLGPQHERNGDNVQPSSSHHVGESGVHGESSGETKRAGFFSPEERQLMGLHMPLESQTLLRGAQ